jgi:hypothetical protein
MDLVRRAQFRGHPHVASVWDWHVAIQGSATLAAFARNLVQDVTTEFVTRGAQAIDKMIDALCASSPPTDDLALCDTVRQTLKTHSPDVLCRGLPIDHDPSTDRMARRISAMAYFRHLRDPAASRSVPLSIAAVMTRLNDAFPGGMPASNALAPGAEISAELPSVFAGVADDVRDKIRIDGDPKSFTTRRLSQYFGIPASDEVMLILRFYRSRLGDAGADTGHVPTAFDAFNHAEWLAPAPGDTWGYARDLASAGTVRGARECVFRPFSAKLVDDWNPAAPDARVDHLFG